MSPLRPWLPLAYSCVTRLTPRVAWSATHRKPNNKQHTRESLCKGNEEKNNSELPTQTPAVRLIEAGKSPVSSILYTACFKVRMTTSIIRPDCKATRYIQYSRMRLALWTNCGKQNKCANSRNSYGSVASTMGISIFPGCIHVGNPENIHRDPVQHNNYYSTAVNSNGQERLPRKKSLEKSKQLPGIVYFVMPKSICVRFRRRDIRQTAEYGRFTVGRQR